MKAKNAITKCWLQKNPPTLRLFKNIINNICSMEKITFTLQKERGNIYILGKNGIVINTKTPNMCSIFFFISDCIGTYCVLYLYLFSSHVLLPHNCNTMSKSSSVLCQNIFKKKTCYMLIVILVFVVPLPCLYSNADKSPC